MLNASSEETDWGTSDVRAGLEHYISCESPTCEHHLFEWMRKFKDTRTCPYVGSADLGRHES